MSGSAVVCRHSHAVRDHPARSTAYTARNSSEVHLAVPAAPLGHPGPIRSIELNIRLAPDSGTAPPHWAHVAAAFAVPLSRPAHLVHVIAQLTRHGNLLATYPATPDECAQEACHAHSAKTHARFVPDVEIRR